MLPCSHHLATSWGFRVSSLHNRGWSQVLSGFVRETTDNWPLKLPSVPEGNFPPYGHPWLPQPSTGLLPPFFPDQNPGHFTCPIMTVDLWWSFWGQPNCLFFPYVWMLIRQTVVITVVVIIFRISTHCHESPQMSEVGNSLGEWGKISSRRSHISWVMMDE